MTAMRPFLMRRREIPCLCLLVREVLRERFGYEAGRFRVVFSEGVGVIGDASGLFDYMALDPDPPGGVRIRLLFCRAPKSHQKSRFVKFIINQQYDIIQQV
jgi:hypothetical protein